MLYYTDTLKIVESLLVDAPGVQIKEINNIKRLTTAEQRRAAGSSSSSRCSIELSIRLVVDLEALQGRNSVKI